MRMSPSIRSSLYRFHWAVRSRAARFGLLQALALAEESQYWPRERLEALRNRKLRGLVAHFHAQSPYYRVLMTRHGVSPADIRGVADIGKLPILTKAMIREHAPALQARGFPDSRVEFGITGGTTGNPMRVARDLPGTVWQRACYWRGFGWGGLHLGDTWFQLFGGALGLSSMRTKDRLKNWFSGKHFLPAFELQGHNTEKYIEAIRASGARHLVGYASSCFILARHLESTGRTLPLDAVFPTAELLPDSWFDTMRRAFGAKVLPYYGCGEVQSLGYTCPDGDTSAYHTCDEHAVIEVEDRDGRTSLEGDGAFLLTDLDNAAMPLLRYRNGDAGAIAGPGCRCGRSLGRILRLDGRVNDVLLTGDGEMISGAIGAHAFKMVAHVHQFQIVQGEPGHARIRIVTRPGYDAPAEEDKLRRIFKAHLGEQARIEIEYPSEIATTVAGKARLVINEHLERAAAATAPARVQG